MRNARRRAVWSAASTQNEKKTKQPITHQSNHQQYAIESHKKITNNNSNNQTSS